MLIKIQTIQKLNVITVSLPPAAPQVHDPTRGNIMNRLVSFFQNIFYAFTYLYLYLLLYIIVKLLKSI